MKDSLQPLSVCVRHVAGPELADRLADPISVLEVQNGVLGVPVYEEYGRLVNAVDAAPVAGGPFFGRRNPWSS